MSFDFNLSSDDDGDDDDFEEGNLFGGILKGNSGNDAGVGVGTAAVAAAVAVAVTTATKAVADDDGDGDDDDSSDGSRNNNNNNEDGFDVDFDGYDDYYDFEDSDDRKPSSMDSSSLEAIAFPSDFDVVSEEKKDGGMDDDDDDDDEIDWEDAEEETGETTSTLKAVTLELGDANRSQTANNTKKQSKKRSRSVSVFRHNKLHGNPNLQYLLGELHKASLLAWASHAHCLSGYASNDLCLGLAHSLLPNAWLSSSSSSSSSMAIPTADDIGHFLQWFMEYVKPPSSSFRSSSRSVRRQWQASSSPKQKTNNSRNDGASATPCSGGFVSANYFRLPDFCSHLSNTHNHHMLPNNHPEDALFKFTDCDALLLFLSMVRSMGWRARYMVAMEPIPRDLDVDHPLFHNEQSSSGSGSILSRFFGRAAAFAKGKKETPIAVDDDDDHEGEDSKQPARKRGNKTVSPKKLPQHFPASLYSNSNSNSNGNSIRASRHICWVEVLCKTNKGNHPNNNSRRSPRAATASKSPPKMQMQWMHVDPISGISNRPSVVEENLFDIDNNKQRSKSAAGGGTTSSRGRDGGSRNRGQKRRPISYALAVEHLHSLSQHQENSQQKKKPPDTDTDDDLLVKMTDVTRRYASSMVDTMEARGIIQQKASSKPKRRKIKRAMMVGAVPAIREKEERPDEWFSKFLDVISNRRKSSSRNRKKPPPPSSKATREALKSRGNSREDAIALDGDGDESDSNKKPAAVDDKKEQPHDNDNDDSDGFDGDIANIDHEEESQLNESAKQEPLPTSKAAFKKHPLYVIRSVLNSTEVLTPDAKNNVSGMFKGELVYRRTVVETALSAKRWRYEGRRVKDTEVKTPILKVKARKPPTPKGFQALKSYGVGASNDGSEQSRVQQIEAASAPPGDGKESLYGSWQTDAWGPPPVDPGDPIPVNEHNNVELELLNPGLVHVELYRVAKVAKKLGLPYAPCLLGFERSGRPTIRGIVVHETNEELLLEAHAAMSDYLMKEEHEKRENAILLRWKRLLVGVLTKDRLEREYGDKDEDDD
jgi:hypothetical protein